MEDKKIIKKTIDMAWPSVVESFFVAFAGLVDSLMVSSMGSYAVAAVGLTTQPKFICLAVFIAANVAVSALVARRRGENDRDSANKILFSALAFIIVMAVIISIVSIVFSDPLIRLSGSEPETHDLAVLYYRIIMAGMIFNVISLGINAAQRGAGNTKIAMYTNVTSNLINILFNYLLIEGHLGFPALGITGAALATVLGTVVACVMSIISILKADNFVSIPYIINNKIRFCIDAFKSIISVGYSVFFEQLLMRIGFFATSMMAARQGTAGMAAHQVGMNIMSLSFSFGDGLQAAAVALIGQSLGQGNPELAKKYGRTCRIIGGLISAMLAVIYWFGGEFLYNLFFDEEEIVKIGIDIMRVIILIVLFQIGQVIYMGCLRGAGDTLYTAIASTISVTIIRTVCCYLFCYTFGFGIIGIWFGILADQISRYAFASVRFKAGNWVKIKI